MKFLTITLKGVRNFHEKTIEFQDGLNIVCGPNESGKTTILDSLLFCITGDPRELNSLIQWKAEHSSINVQYETETTQVYTLTRTLFPEQEAKLENTVIMEDPDAISTMLREHFGSTNKMILENSSVVKHNEMEVLRKMDSKEIVKDQMQVALSGNVERSTEDVIRVLERSIADLDLSLREVEYKRENLERRLNPYTGIDEEYSNLTNKIKVYQDDLEDYQGKYEAYTSRILYGDLTRDIKETCKRLEHIEDIESYSAAIPFGEVAEIETLQMELKRKEEGMESLISLIKEREKELGKYQKGGFFTWVKSLFGKDVHAEKRISTQEDLLRSYKEDQYKLEREAEEIRARIKELNNQTSSYKGMRPEELNHIKERNQRKVEELLQGLTKEELVNLIYKKQDDADKLRSAIFREHPELLEKDDQQIHHEKGYLEGKVGILEKESEDTQLMLEDVTRRKQEKDRIQGELNRVNAQKEELDTKKAVDQLVLDTIRSVYTDLKDLFIPQLEEKTGQILQKITRGKYSKISIRREDLAIFVEVPDRMLNIALLSQGTKDQLYFSLRIALSELLSGGRNLPLLFDESFYTSDEKRLKETIAVLQEIAQNTQVILFTHNEDFLEYGTPIMLTPEREFHQLY